MTSKENLKNIIESLNPELNEITHVVLKSQIHSKAKRPSLSKNK